MVTNTTFRPGDMVAGKYRIERQLGIGGMGVVFAATHVHLNEPVALKMVLPEASDHRGARERFLREAQIAVKIRSEHVARVIDLGFLENGAPFMAMELLRGKDLAALVRECGALPIPTALDFVLQACEAITEAHLLGMVHRDLKPANLFLTTRPDGSPFVKVLDFGISTAPTAQQTDARLTSTGALMGSPSYMSPEQIRDAKSVDQRCDVWAVGMILYELVSNRVAFNATTVPGLLASIIADAPVPIQAVRPDVPPRLAAAIMGCLEKDLRRRTQTIADVARALAEFAPPASQSSVERIAKLQSYGQRSAPPAPISSKTAFDETQASSPPALPATPSDPKRASGRGTGSPAWGSTVPEPPKRRGALIGAVAGAVLLVGLGMGGALYLRPHRVPDAIAAAASVPPPVTAAPLLEPAAASMQANVTPPSSAAPAPFSSVAPKRRVGKGSAPAPSSAESKTGELGAAIDSRK